MHNVQILFKRVVEGSNFTSGILYITYLLQNLTGGTESAFPLVLKTLLSLFPGGKQRHLDGIKCFRFPTS